MLDRRVAAFAQSWAHFNDIGGMRAGSLSPECEEIFQEGIIVSRVLSRATGGNPPTGHLVISMVTSKRYSGLRSIPRKREAYAAMY